ncbi:MAG: excinuclease ABC subunit B [Caldiserica bacterium]|nr:MAG: excinuclease ABC subunit B [Caldisericota bacterium]
MKLCDICKKKPATVQFTQIINNEVKKLNLCEECAEKMGLFSDFFTTAGGTLLSPFLKGLSEFFEEEIRCKGCGLSLSEFQETGKFGCSACYETFKTQIKGLLKRLHGSLTHKGKTPKIPKESIEDRIKKLEEELKEAVRKEEYERAAVLRDKIRELKKKK